MCRLQNSLCVMANPKIIEASIDSLIPDNKNFNKGTEFGEHLMDKSLREFGLGRSILIDKNNRIIAGNKTTEIAADIGFDNVIIVETDGKSLVAVKRKDIDLDSAKGRELALADNATSKANLSFDTDLIMQEAEKFDFPLKIGVFRLMSRKKKAKIMMTRPERSLTQDLLSNVGMLPNYHCYSTSYRKGALSVN